MRVKVKSAVTGLLVMAAWGCSSSGPQPEPAAPAPAVAAPRAGTNFDILYVRGGELWRQDTRSGSHTQLETESGGAGFVPAAAGGVFAAVRHAGEASGLFLVAPEGRRIVPVHEGGEGAYTFAWSADGARLAYAYRPAETSGSGRGVFVVGPDGVPSSVGCRAADRVHAWSGESALLVGDAANVYTVSVDDCATLATLPRQGKQDFAYAGNGSKLSFVRRTPQGPELHIANHDGSGAVKIADPQVRPRNVRWAPNGGQVAFEIDSPRFANRTHVAIHDVARNRVAYNDRETPLGVPNEGNACWSPNSRRVLFDRVFDRSDGVQSYQTRQKVVKAGAVETVVFEELRRDGAGGDANPCRWLDDQHVLIVSNDGHRVINVDTRDEFMVGGADAVLVVQVYE